MIKPVLRSINFGFTREVRRSSFAPKIRPRWTGIPVYAKTNDLTWKEGMKVVTPERWLVSTFESSLAKDHAPKLEKVETAYR